MEFVCLNRSGWLVGHRIRLVELEGYMTPAIQPQLRARLALSQEYMGTAMTVGQFMSSVLHNA